MTKAAVPVEVGRIVEGSVVRSCRLGRLEDERIVDLFLPLLMQGIYSKSQSAGSSFEGAIKRLCFLLPDRSLQPVLNQLMPVGVLR